jgi:hypothetical protein
MPRSRKTLDDISSTIEVNMNDLSTDPKPVTPARRAGIRNPLVGIGVAIFVLVALAAAIFGTPAGRGAAPAPTTPPSELRPTPQPVAITILHTNDTWGYLLPCG